MADYGIKVSQTGFDVKTCDKKDLVMNSELNLLKTKATGTSSTNVAHGLSYTPIFFSTFAKASGKYSFVGSDNSYIDATNLVPPGYTIRYYIFYQTGL